MKDLFKPNCIRTFTGKSVNVFDPKPEMFEIKDFAHALSKEQRFGNHLSKNYSVAQHCIICAELSPAEHKLTALCHDLAEALIRDLPKPIKIRMPQYEEIEHNLMKCLSTKFRFTYPLPEKVKEIDDLMLIKEWNALMLGNEPFNYVLLTQAQAKIKFLQTFKELSKQ